MTNPIIRIVDDDPQVAESLRFYLEVSGFQVLAYESGEAFLLNDDRSRVGCLLLDVRMPTMSGLELQHVLNAEHALLPIVFLSAHADVSMAVDAVRQGASGFVEKPPKPEVLLSELKKAVALHEKRIKMQREIDEIDAQLAKLTPAEEETAKLIAKGLSNAEIAEIMNLAESTVRRRRADIASKLDTQNAVEVSELYRWKMQLKEELP